MAKRRNSLGEMFMRSKRPVKGNEKIAPIESNELGTRVKYHVDTQPINPRNSKDHVDAEDEGGLAVAATLKYAKKTG